MKTFVPDPDSIERTWLLVDAADKTLGRLATRIANLLRGKNKTIFTPHVDTGDFVVVINAAKVRLTGAKEEQKQYMHFTGFRGHEHYETVAQLRARHPDRIIKSAVHGMLPNNHTRQHLMKRLKVYAGEQHPHAAQGPKAAAI